jgi:hypothetical protein
MRRRRPSDETLAALRTRLEPLPQRSTERQALVQNCADLHGVSTDTIYRTLRDGPLPCQTLARRFGFISSDTRACRQLSQQRTETI